MNDELDEVSEALRAESEAWDRLLDGMRQDVPGPAPAWLEGRVMDEVRAVSMGSEEGVHWWVRRRTLRLSPLALGMGAAAVLAMAVGPWILQGSRGGGLAVADPAVGSAGEVDAVVYVQFVLDAPDASSVAVSGDFNEWDRTVHWLEDTDGDGIWSGRIPMAPGIHEYMFVVDGDRWVTDPRADRYADDGFGNQNALLAVPGPGRT